MPRNNPLLDGGDHWDMRNARWRIEDMAANATHSNGEVRPLTLEDIENSIRSLRDAAPLPHTHIHIMPSTEVRTISLTPDDPFVRMSPQGGSPSFSSRGGDQEAKAEIWRRQNPSWSPNKWEA